MTEHQEAHARLSPSSSKRWMACPGSITLSARFPNTGNTYSDNGTAMHTVAKMCLTEHWSARKAVGTKVPVHAPGELSRVVTFTEGMAETTQGYVDTVRHLGIGNLMLIEHRVDFSPFVGVPGQFGTADAIILQPIDGHPDVFELLVIDLKTGFVRVDPEENSQAMLYALGAYAEFELTHQIKQVRIGIYQPEHGGLREWVCSIERLLEFAEAARVRAALVEEAAASRDILLNPIDADEWARVYLNPSPNEDECRFCPAMAGCPAWASKVEDTLGMTLAAAADCFTVADESGKPPGVPVPDAADRLSLAMRVAGGLEDWAKAVRAEVERRLLAGLPVDGFGLELGRQGARAWTDAAAAEAMLRKTFRIKVEEAYDMALKSPTSIEKLGPKRNRKGEIVEPKPGEPAPVISARQWDKLQPLIKRAPAKPSVKPAAEISVPYIPPAPDAGTFENVEDESENLA